MLRLSLLALCYISLKGCSPTKHLEINLDVEHPVLNTTLKFESINNRIINGVNAFNVPWVALIVTTFEHLPGGVIKYAHNCGGSLISPRYVLTSRTCVFRSDDPTQLSSNQFWVFVGIHNNVLDGQQIKVVKIVAYNAYSNDDDVALLKLEYDVYGILPISVQYDDNIDYKGKIATIYGWGVTETGQPSHVLKTADVVLWGRDQCLPKSVCSNPEITHTNICDTDWGGPLVLKENGNLIGLARYSFIVDGQPCSGDHAVFSSTSYYGDWIHSVIAAD